MLTYAFKQFQLLYRPIRVRVIMEFHPWFMSLCIMMECDLRITYRPFLLQEWVGCYTRRSWWWLIYCDVFLFRDLTLMQWLLMQTFEGYVLKTCGLAHFISIHVFHRFVQVGVFLLHLFPHLAFWCVILTFGHDRCNQEPGGIIVYLVYGVLNYAGTGHCTGTGHYTGSGC